MIDDEQARKIAQQERFHRIPSEAQIGEIDARFIELVRENEHGETEVCHRRVWVVTFATPDSRFDMALDAQTGEVLRVRK